MLDGKSEQSQPVFESETEQFSNGSKRPVHNLRTAGDTRVNGCNKATSGAARAQWLSELSKAIDQAQWLAWRIGVVEGRNAQAMELYVQLEVLRAEVEALRGRDLRNLRHPPSTAFPEGIEAANPALDALGNLAASREGLEE